MLRFVSRLAWALVVPLFLGGGGCQPAARAPAGPAPAAYSFMPLQEPGRAFTLRSQFRNLRLQNLTFAVQPPRNPKLWYLGEREGRILAAPNDEEAADAVTVLDLRKHTLGWQDTGLLNMVFHPEFGKPDSPNRGFIYVWYNHTDKPHPGPGQPFVGSHSTNRLSRFTIFDGEQRADPASELVLLEQQRDNVDHQGGGMFFHPEDGFLYLGVGDGGHPYFESRGSHYMINADEAQRLDKELLSGVLRIDVDRRGGTISHAIRRQPKHGHTQGYNIPNDNPWLDPDGGVLEEFFAIGLRNPHRLSHDRETNRIFAGDVGEGRFEEIDTIERGNNYQWKYLEGKTPYAPKPERIRGVERGPLHVFAHDGRFSSVIGGFVYRGRALPSLVGKYVFGDNGNGQIFTLDAGAMAPAKATRLLRLPTETIAYAGLSSFAVDAEGEIYLCVLGQNEKATGALLKLVAAPAAPAAPPTLSATHLFTDTELLTPAAELFPYEVNAPFWSDHKLKTRWIHVPAGEGITFRSTGDWDFPAGTIAVKHFDLALDEREPKKRRRLETRVLVLDERGGAYGRTYKWRPDQSDADLLAEPVSEILTTVAKEPFGPFTRASLGGGGEGSSEDRQGGALALTSPNNGTLFLHVPADGDFDVAASFNRLNGGAAGLMLRAGLAPKSPSLFLAWESGVTGGPPRGVRVERRFAEETNTVRAEVPGSWLRLHRAGGVLRGYTSEDGLVWREIGGVTWRGIAGSHVGIALAGEGGNASVDVAVRRRQLARDHYYPSGEDCMSCHTRSAHFVLGASTRQWNREVPVSGGGHANQLVLASRHGVLNGQITAEQAAGWKKLSAIDDASASLEERARSYLDANCAQCHRPGVLVQLGLDARYDTPLGKQGIVNGAVRWPVVPRPQELIVVPKDPDRSRIYMRVRDHRMPPLGSMLPNTQALDLLEKWILSLEGPPVLREVKMQASTSGGIVRVTLSHPDPNARIHYTTDGTIPSPETPRYGAPLELSRAATVRAAAFRQGYGPSRTNSIEVEPPPN